MQRLPGKWHGQMIVFEEEVQGKYTPEQINRFPPAEWPLVRTHPGSGRKLLFVGVHCDRVSGMAVPEARVLIADLIEHATQRKFVYAHEWKPFDLVIWDNQATMHRGRPFDPKEVRDMHRTTLFGDEPVQ